MALRNEDKAWIRESTAAQIADVTASLRPHGWRKLVYTLREVGPIIGTCAFVLALIGIAVTLGINVVSGRSEEASFRGHTEERLKNLESGVAEIKSMLTRQSLAAHAALPLPDFKATLSDLGSSVAAAQQEHLKVPPRVVDDLAQKMTAIDANAPDFWPAAGALITYRAFLLVGGSRNWAINFPSCPGTVDLDSSPDASVQGRLPGGGLTPKLPIERVGNQDCYVELDGKKVSRWDCKRCLVKYSGGPLSLRDVRFEDCLFVFDFRSKPAAPDGERLSRTLLASESQNIDLPAS